MQFYKNLLCSFLILIVSSHLSAQNKFETPYGNNKEVGKYVEINGAKIYYEEYGKGEPLLFIHGNGGNISGSSNRIEYFKSKYRVIAADSRGHGKSDMNTDSLTYRQIASDLEGLVAHLKLDSLNIVGVSDGAIVSFIMGANGNTDIKKIVAWAGNLRPDTTAVRPFAPAGIKKRYDGIKKAMPNGKYPPYIERNMQRYGLMLFQPQITHEELQKITAGVLVMAADRDVIKNSHSLEIFEHIPRAQLCIIPGATHFFPIQAPDLFIFVIERFLSVPFSMPDTDSGN